MTDKGHSLASISTAAGDFLESGDPGRALPLYREAVSIAGAAGLQEELSNLLGDMAVAYRRLGDVAAAMETNRRAIEAARACGHDLNVARWSGNLGSLLRHYRNDLDGAEALFRDAMEAATRTGLPEQVSLAAGHLAGMMGERGRFSEAVAAMARAREHAAKNPVVAAIIRDQEIDLFVSWARSLREENRIREARETIGRSLEVAKHTKYETPLLLLLAEIAEQEGDIVSASEVVERAAAASEASGDRDQANELRDLARRMKG